MRPIHLVGLALIVGACGGESGANAGSAAAEGGTYAPVAEYKPGHFGIGTAATRAQIAAWDTDIGPEGLELPAGKGSARAGAEVYRTQCAACHGASGEGMAPVFPALIGRDPRGESFDFASDPSIPRTIGNYWSHATTLYDYIRRAMPLYTPGSLSADDTYAVTAYLLAANQVIPDTAVLDAAALRAVKMPARDRYVADDRSPTTR
jgi:mono/diheme cytochrome c family protein